MKKAISVLLVLALCLGLIPAFAEGADLTGLWYIQRGISNGTELQVVVPEALTLDLKEDGTFEMNTDGNQTVGTWTQADGVATLEAEGQAIEFRLEGEELVMAAEGGGIYLARTPAEPMEFPSPVVAESAEAFNGTWKPVAQISTGLYGKLENGAEDQFGTIVFENGVGKTLSEGAEASELAYTFDGGMMYAQDDSFLPTVITVVLLEDDTLLYQATMTLGEARMSIILILARAEDA